MSIALTHAPKLVPPPAGRPVALHLGGVTKRHGAGAAVTRRERAAPGDGQIAQTLDRGLAVLELLAAVGGGLTVSEVAAALGVHRTIAYRLLGTLERRTLVQRSEDGRYRPGGGLLRLSAGVGDQLRVVAVPHLRALRTDTDETVHLAVRTGTDVLFTGGPVSPHGAVCVAKVADPAEEPPGWRRVIGDIGLLHLDTPVELAAGGYTALRIYAGYSGWSPGQLEDELARGQWYRMDSREDDIFTADPNGLWRRVLGRHGGTPALLSTWPDDPELN